MIVSQLKWMSKAGAEAEVLVASTTGDFAVWAFCCPCDFAVGDAVELPLGTLDVIAFATEEREPRAYWQKSLGPWCYNFVGRLLDTSTSLADVGGLLIELDTDIPWEIEEGDWFEFTCGRLDL
ncbi:hypothetical protein [Bradymonas sediminis]|uniref:Uncharacterized protein n=1 Tax=Bradymonas sediminis TaxID=1548548 RepID=A0A2Z4FKF8_9DELT|nr:hypothetical protein [Bradymonas sediminis]AWV89439.1 hypothetical protein DN745_08850 [Bradymonas sediminis]TDP76835.1 hypothetical protein DFR33_102472 [Bradymonas sediminis]